jgi:colanic acid biosynthesis glycosyl transferase WcaI
MAKILVVSQHYWPEDFRLNDLTEILVENKHQVTVLTGQPNYPTGTPFPGYRWWKFSCETHKGIKIYRVPLWPRHSGRAIHLVINYLSFNFFTILASPYFVFRKFDHVIAWGTSPIFQGLAGAVIAKLKRIPFTVWVLDLWPESLSATGTVRNKSALNFVLLFVKLFYRLCDNILCISESFISHIQAQNVAPHKLKYFPNWAEDFYQSTEPARPKTLPADFNFPQGTIITYAGNIGTAQDIENIAEAIKLCKQVSNLTFIFLGDGRQKDWFEKKIAQEKLSDKVKLLGRFPPSDMPYFFKNSDAFLVTLKDEDIFSKTLPGRVMSFMAAGKPLITAAAGETDSVVSKSHSGLSVPAGNPQALAEAIQKFMVLSQDEKKQMAVNSKKYFSDYFTREKVYPRLKNLIGL